MKRFPVRNGGRQRGDSSGLDRAKTDLKMVRKTGLSQELFKELIFRIVSAGDKGGKSDSWGRTGVTLEA